MQITTATIYGILALRELGKANGSMTADELGTRLNISACYGRKIAALLSQAKLVRSTRGPNGGYVLRKHPAELRLVDVIEALDGEFCPVVDGDSQAMLAVRKKLGGLLRRGLGQITMEAI